MTIINVRQGTEGAINVSARPAAGTGVTRAGPRGKGWVFDNGAPSDLVGADGDMYYDTDPLTGHKAYGPKALGTWSNTPVVEFKADADIALMAQAAAAASAAQAAENAEQTGEDRTQTGQDMTATAADRVQTGLDRVATGQDMTATAADRVQTGLDRVATGQDMTATAADRVQTGLDRVATGQDMTATAADRVQTGLDRTASAQSASEAAASASTVTPVNQQITAALAKATPVDADTFGLVDSAANGALKKLTWANVKAALVSLFASAAQGVKADGAIQGPVTSVDNAIVRFDGTTGKLAQNSTVAVDDAGNITVTGTVDGRDLSVDGVKLDGIASGATANTGTVTSVGLSLPLGLTVSESPVSTSGTLTAVWTAGYQAYTSAEASKLAGIAAGADATGVAVLAAATKTTPVDADTIVITDSAVSNGLKRLTWVNVKAALKTYFDTLYATVSHTHTVSQLSDATANARSLLQAANYATMFGLLKQVASDTVTGVVELATSAEVIIGTDTVRAATAAGVKAHVDARVGTSAGNLVELDGAGKLPSVDGSQLINVASGNAPGWKLLQAVSIDTTVAAVDFTDLDPAFDEFILEIVNVIGDTISTPYLRTSANTGPSPTFDSGAADYGHAILMLSGSTPASIAVAGTTQLTLQDRTMIIANGVPLVGQIRLYTRSGRVAQFVWDIVSQATNAVFFKYYGMGRRNTVTTRVNAVRFLFSAGNIAEGGYINLYGVRKT